MGTIVAEIKKPRSPSGVKTNRVLNTYTLRVERGGSGSVEMTSNIITPTNIKKMVNGTTTYNLQSYNGLEIDNPHHSGQRE
jgi:hypothetical protein